MRRLAYFQGWSDESLARLAAGAKIVHITKGDTLLNKGERPQSLHVVVSGLIRIFIPLPGNCERVLFLVDPGKSLAESCLVLDEVCPFQAVAARDSHVLAVDSLVFRREIGGHVDLTRHALERVSRHLLDTLRDAEICAQRSSVQRVAGYLLLHRPSPADTAFTFRLPARKQDVAAKLGLTQETLSRVLAFLDKQGLIQTAASEIRVEDAARLAQVTSMRDCKETAKEG